MTSTLERGLERMSSAQNTARVLTAFSHSPGPRGVTQLSRDLGLSKSTVHRILTALVAERLLEHDPGTRTYRLSLVSIDLAAAASAPLQLHEAAMPNLVHLHQRTGRTVHLGVLDGTEVVHIEQLVKRNGRHPTSAYNTRLAAHYSSCGKAIMAYLPDAELGALLAAYHFDAPTAHTIADPAQFRRELCMVRARGWSHTVDEREIGVASIAVPVRGPCGQVVAAVAIVCQQEPSREDDWRYYAKPLQLTAAAISQKIRTVLPPGRSRR
ncbi:IclR family transcriptional regulator [[Mycobacterium] crassicus]|uniref:IclR family transcriptional regulator n=1 Tax=[Mycobacterium] crassicus TaxID=2872309 RepID=A0ABU5XJI8_9MYCO|nr:IclR family transcriptional regulator [Mycolicibacter sp. MYC098]MEB3022128.1 IclR family transcriptional regulator [Mycolicibacter sp. MYC098]